jgi:aldehyde:ferredoxin oxidoreductase
MGALAGYAGSFLFVDLTKKSVQRKPINWDYARDFVGGCGYAARLLYDRLNLETLDPFHPDNEVAIFTGPLTATGAPCTGRHGVCTKSALTGIWGESTSGGYFGAELRHAGLDGILITGAASSPLFLDIRDDTDTLKPADHVWGKDTYETETIIRRDAGDDKLRVLSIGPAGENRVRFAAVMNDTGRSSARAGAAAVLGAKRLKAIAVRGTKKVTVSDPDRFREHVRNAFQVLEQLGPVLGENGTAYGVDPLMNLFNDMPVRYFAEPFMPVDKINARALNQLRTGRYRCHLCPIGCGPIISVDVDGVHLKQVAGPEYETIAALGTLCQVDDLVAICHANHLCNIYGLDTISCGNAIAFAFAAQEKGKIPKNLSGSINLRFGDASSMVKLVELIAHRQGIGDLLAEGVRQAAARLGIPQMAVHVKGLEVPMHDPRAFFGLATTYATAPIGAGHMHADVQTTDMGVGYPEFDIESGDPHTDEGKGVIVAKLQNWRSLFNSLTLCQQALLEPTVVTALYNAATGRDLTPLQLLETGHRIITLKRAFNVRCGVTAKDDVLPSALMTPFRSGPNEGKVPDLKRQLQEFYQFQGWDPTTGKPSRDSLERLGLPDVAAHLWPEKAHR